MTQIHYPQKPPVQPPKPELIPGGSRDLPGLWMTHDPAVFYDTEREAYYIYSTGAADVPKTFYIGKTLEKS